MRILAGRPVLAAFVACLAVAQRPASLSVTRLYTGPDGQTHAADMDVKLMPRAGGERYEQSEMLTAAGAQFVRAAPGYVQDWHTAPRRQYLITISGRGEIELAGGQKVPLVPGRPLLVEDLTGKGHLTRTLGSQDRVSLIVPLAGQ